MKRLFSEFWHIFFICIFISLSADRIAAQTGKQPLTANRLTILTWNLQNFRDARSLPEKAWVANRRKAFAKALLASNPPYGPEVALLQEVADIDLLKDILQHELASASYSSISFGRSTSSGVFFDVTLSKLPLQKEAQLLPLKNNNKLLNRNFLQTDFILPGQQTLSIANVHLPPASQPLEERTQALQAILDYAQKHTIDVIGGDLNLTQEDQKPTMLFPKRGAAFLKTTDLLRSSAPASFFFAPTSEWSSLDMLLINKSSHLLKTAQPWSFDTASVRLAHWTTDQTTRAGTPRKFSWKDGTGLSDHWPLTIQIQKNRTTYSDAEKIRKQFAQRPLPKNHSLLTEVQETLVPFFSALKRTHVPFPAHISENYINLLSPSSRNKTFAGSSFEDLWHTTLPPLYATNTKSILLLDRPEIALEPSAEAQSSTARLLPIMAPALLFDSGAGLVFSDNENPLQLLFLPISRHNLRAYTLFNGTLLQDLSYSQLCDQFDARSSSLLSEAWLELISTGFTSQKLSKLTTTEQQFLADAAGIYMAEYYKRLVLGLQPDEKPYMSGANLLQLFLLYDYFQNSGPVVLKSKTQDKRIQPGNCHLFQDDYRHGRCQRILNERILSAYVNENHHSLAHSLKNKLKCQGDNYFSCISTQIDAQRFMLSNAQDDIAAFLHSLIDEKEKIQKFMLQLSDESLADYLKSPYCLTE